MSILYTMSCYREWMIGGCGGLFKRKDAFSLPKTLTFLIPASTSRERTQEFCCCAFRSLGETMFSTQ